MPAALSAESLRPRFDRLGGWLRDHQRLWRPRAFHGFPLAWESEFPAIAEFVDALPERLAYDIDAGGRWTEGGPAELRALAQTGVELSILGRHSVEDAELDPTLLLNVPGRKAAQVEAFVRATTGAASTATAIVDWCSGKGHLGRTLAAVTGRALIGIERDARLCESGAGLARGLAVNARFQAVDAKDLAPRTELIPGRFVVALHACGDLHTELIRSTETDGIALAPCCHNRALGPDGLALLLSSAAQAVAHSGLVIDEADLRLIHEYPSRPGENEQGVLRKNQAWRLGFDAWQKAVCGTTEYRRMPPFPPAWLKLEFADFCCRFAHLAHLPAPAGSLEPFEAAGWSRLDRVRRRDLVRGLFRAPLEVFVVLDRAFALEERGYSTTVGTFCDVPVTPRNSLIIGHRPARRLTTGT